MSAYWKPITGLMEPIAIRAFKGMYFNDDNGFSLPDNYATDGYNMSYLNYPALGVRPGYSLLGTAFSSRIQGIGAWKQQEIHAIVNGTWQRWNGSSWTQIATGLSNTAEPTWTNFQGNLSGVGLFMANGADQLRVWDGSSVQTVTQAPAGANNVVQHDNRIYLNVGNTVYYSALRKYNDFSTPSDSGSLVVETPTGETISAMIAGPKRLTVFKPNAIFDLFGTSAKDYTLIQSANDLGAMNSKCAITIGSIIYFLHQTGVYAYIGSARPRKDFSMPVLSLIRRINPAAINKCAMGSDGKNLYIAIPLDNSTEADTILEYSPDYDCWNVWKGHTATMFANINTTMYIGNVDGSVRKVGGSTDGGQPIAWKWVSKPFSEAMIAQRKTWYRIWTVQDIPIGSTFNVSLSKSTSGDSDWQLIKSVSSTSGFVNSRVDVPAASIANNPFLRTMINGTGPIKVYEMDRQVRRMPMK